MNYSTITPKKLINNENQAKCVFNIHVYWKTIPHTVSGGTQSGHYVLQLQIVPGILHFCFQECTHLIQGRNMERA